MGDALSVIFATLDAFRSVSWHILKLYCSHTDRLLIIQSHLFLIRRKWIILMTSIGKHYWIINSCQSWNRYLKDKQEAISGSRFTNSIAIAVRFNQTPESFYYLRLFLLLYATSSLLTSVAVPSVKNLCDVLIATSVPVNNNKKHSFSVQRISFYYFYHHAFHPYYDEAASVPQSRHSGRLFAVRAKR